VIKLKTNASHHEPEGITGVSNSTTAREHRTSQTWKRKSEDPNVEEAISQCISDLTGRGVRVSGPMFKSKSKQISNELGHNDFKETDGWLSRWKCKFGTELNNKYITQAY
jgi:hypothetical protein